MILIILRFDFIERISLTISINQKSIKIVLLDIYFKFPPSEKVDAKDEIYSLLCGSHVDKPLFSIHQRSRIDYFGASFLAISRICCL